MGIFTDEAYFTDRNGDAIEVAKLEWLNRYLLNKIPVEGVLNGVRADVFSNETLSVDEAQKEEDELRKEYTSLLRSDASENVELLDWYLFELKSWLGYYGYIINRKDYATAEIVMYKSSLTKEEERQNYCDPRPSFKLIATISTLGVENAGTFRLIPPTKEIEEKTFNIERNFGEVRSFIFELEKL
ncbi:MAG: hypothetical protein MJZ34_11130 [Paludibacteraceae bacterium]|nr:hypothetical protein [Paludibacteraceae bacterium]